MVSLKSVFSVFRRKPWLGAPEALPTYVYSIYRLFLVYFLYGHEIFRSGFFRSLAFLNHNVSFISSLMGVKNFSFYLFFCPHLPCFICIFMLCWRFRYFCAQLFFTKPLQSHRHHQWLDKKCGKPCGTVATTYYFSPLLLSKLATQNIATCFVIIFC